LLVGIGLALFTGKTGIRSMRSAEDALAVLRVAINNEVSGQRFYSDAAFYCIDPWAKEIFASLATDEEKHTRLLLIEYEALVTHGRWIEPEEAMEGDAGADADITQITFPDEQLGQELFPPELPAGEAIDRRADDLVALAFGVEMEKQAIVLYEREASASADPMAQKAYEFLIQEETQHHKQLKERWEQLAGRPLE
jgi:rubrerythrin